METICLILTEETKMKFSRVKNLSLGIALAVVVAHIPLNASADAIWLTSPAINTINMYSSIDALSAQEGAVQSIEYDTPLTAALGDENDFIAEDGVSRFDVFQFAVEDASKTYMISVNSSEFTAGSTLAYADEQQQLVLLQSARVYAPNNPVQFSGVLSSPGNYLIFVDSLDGENGSYSIKLTEGDDDVPTPPLVECNNPDPDNPFVESPIGKELSCELTDQEVYWLNAKDGKHYAKVFHLKVQVSTRLTIIANSSAFTPVIGLWDPQTKEIFDKEMNSLTVQASGDVDYFVTSAEAGATGAFTVLVEQANDNSSFTTNADSGVEYDLSKMPANIERR
jgi:hypothetical protein